MLSDLAIGSRVRVRRDPEYVQSDVAHIYLEPRRRQPQRQQRPPLGGTGWKREAGVAMSSDLCGRRVLYSPRNASTIACAASMSGHGGWSCSHSCCSVWCQLSIFPVVVGCRRLVSACSIPFLRRIQSKSTSAGRRHFLGFLVTAVAVGLVSSHLRTSGPPEDLIVGGLGLPRDGPTAQG